jgi:Fe-S-cluster containining protein
MIKIKNNENLDICSKCGGKCCNFMPGINHPEDFNNDKEKMKVALNNNYCIDCWEGGEEENIYYIRPRTEKAKNNKVNYSWGRDKCMFLSKYITKCSLEFDKRPYECKILIPKNNIADICKGPNSKWESANWWKNYQEFLKEEINK